MRTKFGAKRIILSAIMVFAGSIACLNPSIAAQSKEKAQMDVSASEKAKLAGATERSLSKSVYFSWINDGLEGATADQTYANLGFFKWLHDEYGMILDVYTFDAGVLDSCNYYGSFDSARFKQRFPEGFGPAAKKAAEMGTRLGIWGGPDGFGNTPEEAEKRIEQMVSLCRDYNFVHFKLDGYCSGLRKEKESAFIKMMSECRKYSPDLILQCHCLELYGGLAYATTTFWGGSEMYIDVMIQNDRCAPNHRAKAMARGLVEDMTRLHEDHGTCLSSCLDGWEDEMVLAAFGRAIYMCPEIYGNPWLLSDKEFPKFARIFNLYRKYSSILMDGKVLPESYGPSAVSRGDSKSRFLVLRNLTWNDTSYKIKLDEEIGLAPGKSVELRQLHPTEKEIGIFNYGDTVKVNVDSFKACLLYAGTARCDEPGVSGVDYKVVRNVPGKPVEIELLGKPGTSATVKLLNNGGFKSAKLDGADASSILKGSLNIDFPGKLLTQPYNAKLAVMQPVQTPADAKTLYEATVFAADNNALEVRSIERSGWSSTPAVKAAQDAFFNDHEFITHGVWDKNLFDGNDNTGFWPCTRFRGSDLTIDGGCFRLDLGKVMDVDELVLNTGDEFGLEPLWKYTGYWAQVSEDLVNWRSISFAADVKMHIQVNGKMRYLKLGEMPQKLVEVEGFRNGVSIPRENWRASNLFRQDAKDVQKTWQASIKLNEIPATSYLCIAINGKHGREGAYAAAKIGDSYVGCPDRASSYPSNTWGYMAVTAESNYTYYLPLGDSAKGKPIEVYVFAYDGANLDLKPEVWITTKQTHPKGMKLVLDR